MGTRLTVTITTARVSLSISRTLLFPQRKTFYIFFAPKLTTVEPPLGEMGRRAAELVLEKVNNPDAENRCIVLRTEMNCRASTGE